MQDQNDVIAGQLERALPNLPTVYDFDDKFYTKVEKTTPEIVSSRDMRIPFKMRPGGYFGYFNPANGDLGAGDAQKYEKGLISTTHMKLAIGWDLQSEWGTDDRRKALINNVQDNLVDAMKEMRRQTEAQCMTNGTAVIATVTSVSANAGVDTVTCTTDGYRVKLLRSGQKVSVYNAARTTNRTATGPVEIMYVDVPNNTFTIPSVVGHTATDVILPEGLSGSTPVGLYGVPYHVSNSSSGSWLGLTRSSTPEVIANGVNAASAAFAPAHARLAVNKLGDRLGLESKLSPTAWMHPAQIQQYEAAGQLVSVIQKQAKEEGLNLYFNENMQLAGAPIEKSYLWDRTRIDFLTMQFWGRAEMKSIGWHTVGNRKIFELRGPSGGVAAGSVSYLTVSWNLYCKNNAAQSYIYGLAVPTGY